MWTLILQIDLTIYFYFSAPWIDGYNDRKACFQNVCKTEIDISDWIFPCGLDRY